VHRLRKYFAVVLGMLAGAVVLLMALGAIVKVSGADERTGGLMLGVAAPLLMFTVVALSWVAVAKLWRCPACDASVYWLVIWNMSVFAGAASKTCPKCGVELFSPQTARRGVRVLLIMMLIGALFAVGGIAASTMLAKEQQEQQKPLPPG